MGGEEFRLQLQVLNPFISPGVNPEVPLKPKPAPLYTKNSKTLNPHTQTRTTCPCILPTSPTPLPSTQSPPPLPGCSGHPPLLPPLRPPHLRILHQRLRPLPIRRGLRTRHRRLRFALPSSTRRPPLLLANLPSPPSHMPGDGAGAPLLPETSQGGGSSEGEEEEFRDSS